VNYFSKLILINYLCLFLIGVGTGFCYFPSIRTSWHYFPKIKGFIVGFIVCAFGLSSAILTWIVKAMINPDNIKANEEGFYPSEVYDNIPGYHIFLIIAFGVLCFLSIVLVQPFVPEDNEQTQGLTNTNSYEVTTDEEDYTEGNDVEISESKQGINNKNSKSGHSKKKVNLRKAIFSKQNFIFFLLALCNYYFPVAILNTFKTFTNNYKEDLGSDFVFTCMFILYLGNGIFRSVWGYLYDYFGFRKLMMINSSLVIVTSASFYFIIKIKALLIIYLIVISALAGSPFTLVPAGVQTVFGVKHAPEVYGGAFYAFGVSAFIVPILSKILDLAHSDNTTPYMIIYIAGSLLGVIALLLTIFMDMSPYEFEEIEVPEKENTKK